MAHFRCGWGKLLMKRSYLVSLLSSVKAFSVHCWTEMVWLCVCCISKAYQVVVSNARYDANRI